MKKILFIATVVKTHINTFHLPYIKMFKECGYKTVVAAKNDYEDGKVNIPDCDLYIDIPFARNPFSASNIKAYKMLKSVIDNGNFDIIECNTPVGSVIGRLAARGARKKGTKVIYIAHGFHFFRGSSKLAWLMFYPVERLLAHITDVLVTINREDYERASKKFKAKQIVHIDGIGVDLERIENSCPDKSKVRREFGIKESDTVLISVGELRKLKNHRTIIEAMAKIENKNLHYIIAGCGTFGSELSELAERHGIKDRVHLPGFRNDVFDLLKSSDIFCFPSTREGMPLALMEAMAAGLPAVASNVRGNRDLIAPGKGGFLYSANDSDGFAEGIKKLIDDPSLRRKMGSYNKERIKKYDIKIIKEKLFRIYFPDGKDSSRRGEKSAAL